MDLAILLLNMILAFTNAYMAGKLRAALEIAQLEGLPRNWSMTALWAANVICAVYFIISIYGAGISRATNG